ncbi:AAA family ATPase [Methylobacterium sp. SD274]|uniref:AAA family ATPase n=1 Tax=Methylobacterium sp. SD274 TaxID=2782009 RepID=UPI001A97805E|nr:AAA family ATPase [Methylobacterium sp. SD274]MBO1022753.1 AAA family ATPase [Methylobacterium sp. SD274]
MTKNTPRGARPRAPASDPFAPHHPPSVDLLDQGLDFLDCDPMADAIHWSTGILLDLPDQPLPVRAALEKLSSCRVSLSSLSHTESVCEELSEDLKLGQDHRDTYGDWATRCVYYQAFLGDHVCALRCAVRVWQIAMAGGHSELSLSNLITTHAEMMTIAACCDEGEWRPKTEPRSVRRQRDGRSALEIIVRSVPPLEWPYNAKRGPVRDDTGFDPRDADEDDLPEPGEAGHLVLRSTSHLNTSAQKEWKSVTGTLLPLTPVPDLAEASTTLSREFPHLRGEIDGILRTQVGRPYARLPFTILVGEPGAGKTRAARRLCEVLGLPVTVYSAAGSADGTIIGTSRQWNSSRACVPLQAIQQALRATVAVIVDEVDKAGSRSDNGRIVDGLLTLIEPENASRYHDPSLECAVDISPVSWIATANSLSGIPQALLDRARTVHMPSPTKADLPALARSIAADVRAERGVDLAWMPDLDGDEIELAARAWTKPSLRQLRRIVETILAGRDALATMN